MNGLCVAYIERIDNGLLSGPVFVSLVVSMVVQSLIGEKPCRILTSLNQCGSHPQIPGRSLTEMTASLSYCGVVCTQSSVVRPVVFFPHLKRDTKRLQTCRSSLSPSHRDVPCAAGCAMWF